MRSRRYKSNEGEGSSYDLSISDLMAALCCVFVLFTIGITTSLKEKNMAANQYNETKVQIAGEISEALKQYEDMGIVSFDKEKLILRFSAKRAFEENKADLKKEFESDLNKIFPVLMRTLYLSEKKEDIEEIRIEGFTATDRSDGPGADAKYSNPYIKRFTEYGEGKNHDYITGFTLSQERTMYVLSYCMSTDYMEGMPDWQRDDYKEWVRSHVSASGYSFNRPLEEKKDRQGNTVLEETTLEKQNSLSETDKASSKNSSRRVEFRIKTNADKVLREYETKKDSPQ